MMLQLAQETPWQGRLIEEEEEAVSEREAFANSSGGALKLV